MQDNVSMGTLEKDIEVKYGMYNLGPEREAARGSLKYILADMNDIRKSFIRLGFHLAEMLHNKYYEDFGYCTMEEFAEANLGMDKSNVYRYIRVYEQFAAVSKPTFSNDLSSTPPKMFLDERWKDYSFSQLVEMCSMSDDQRRACNPGMTIKKLSGQSGLDAENVVTSPQKDKSKEFLYDYCSGLHGAAQAAFSGFSKKFFMRSVYKKVFVALDFMGSDDMLMESMTRRQIYIGEGGKRSAAGRKTYHAGKSK